MRPDAGPLNKPVHQPGLNAQQVLESAAQYRLGFSLCGGR